MYTSGIMTASHTDIAWMTAALNQGRMAADLGEVPVGAVAVAGGEITARAHNRIELDRDAAAHAEMLLLRDVCRILNRWRLDEVTVYVTVEPCPMCAMALVLHRVARVVFGAPEPRTGAAGSFINLLNNPALNHAVEVTAGVCRDDAAELMQTFFRNRRESK